MKKTTVSSKLIDSLKNIVTKAKRRFFFLSSTPMNNEKLSFDEASNIQKDAYVKSVKRSVKKERTPPYMELAAQLLADEEQIFKAAANHLAGIAMSRPKYKAQIKAIFAEVVANRKLSKEKSDYINSKINNI